MIQSKELIQDINDVAPKIIKNRSKILSIIMDFILLKTKYKLLAISFLTIIIVLILGNENLLNYVLNLFNIYNVMSYLHTLSTRLSSFFLLNCE